MRWLILKPGQEPDRTEVYGLCRMLTYCKSVCISVAYYLLYKHMLSVHIRGSEIISIAFGKKLCELDPRSPCPGDKLRFLWEDKRIPKQREP